MENTKTNKKTKTLKDILSSSTVLPSVLVGCCVFIGSDSYGYSVAASVALANILDAIYAISKKSVESGFFLFCIFTLI